MVQNQYTQTQQNKAADNINQTTGKDVSDLCSVIAKQIDKVVEQRITKAEFDKTYYGMISAVYFDGNTDKTAKEYQMYQISYNGYTQNIYIRDEIIHSVGDRIVVTIPNNKFKDRRVQVLTPNPHPTKISITEDESKITETWTNAVGTTVTREFLIEKDENDNIVAITFPDGSVMNVEGF